MDRSIELKSQRFSFTHTKRAAYHPSSKKKLRTPTSKTSKKYDTKKKQEPRIQKVQKQKKTYIPWNQTWKSQAASLRSNPSLNTLGVLQSQKWVNESKSGTMGARWKELDGMGSRFGAGEVGKYSGEGGRGVRMKQPRLVFTRVPSLL